MHNIGKSTYSKCYFRTIRQNTLNTGTYVFVKKQNMHDTHA